MQAKPVALSCQSTASHMKTGAGGTIQETVKNESRQKSTTGLSRKRYNKTKNRLVIGALNVRTFANRTDIMERKEVKWGKQE